MLTKQNSIVRMIKKQGEKMPWQARLDATGTLHHIIIRGIERRRITDDDKDQNNFVFRLGEIASDTKTTIYAWALMTNHSYTNTQRTARDIPIYETFSNRLCNNI